MRRVVAQNNKFSRPGSMNNSIICNNLLYIFGLYWRQSVSQGIIGETQKKWRIIIR